MQRSELIELAVLCLIRRGDEVLLQDRVKPDWRGYALPGGHVEPGESVVEAVIREMREETGLTVRRPRLCGVKQFPGEAGRYLVLLFTADEFDGELTSSAEGEMRWVKRAELGSLEAVADLELLIRTMEDPGLTEFQYLIAEERWIPVVR